MQQRGMHRPLQATLAVIAALAAMFLAACGGGSSSTTSGTADTSGSTGSAGGTATGTPADTGTPVKGGTLVVGQDGDSGCLDPQQAQLNDMRTIGRQFTDSLTFQDPKTGEIKPWLAKSWKVNDDATSFTFTLRDDVTFSDGSKLDAQVVKDNLDGIVKLGAAALSSGPYLADYKGSKVTGDDTIVVTFKSPNAPFLQATSTPEMGIISDAGAKATPEERCQGDVIKGSGPFVVDSFTPNKSIVLSRRSDYNWAPAEMPNQGDAYLDRIEFRDIPDQSVRAGSLVSGQIDFDRNLASQAFQQVKDAGLTVDTPMNPGFPVTYFVNPTRGPLKDEAVRKAVQIGLDREQLLTVFTDPEAYKVATDVLSPTTPGYKDRSDLLAFDGARANQLLDDAGWAKGEDGIRSKDGEKLSFKVMYYSPAYDVLVPQMELMQQQLKQIGVDMQLEPVPIASGGVRFGKRDYDVAVGGRTRADPDALSTVLGVDPQVDAAIAKQRSTLDPAKRQTAVDEASRILLEQGYVWPTYNLSVPQGIGKDLRGIQLDATQYPMFVNTWKSGS